MTTSELIARLRELDPDGTMPVVIADDMGNFERERMGCERMVKLDDEWFDRSDDEDPAAVEVILL